MPLSDKELETFLWERPLTCSKRGLYAWQSFFAHGRRYSQVPMGRCGVAQQVSVRFLVDRNAYYVQVVASTTGTITAAHYRQAQQQLAALRALLHYASWTVGLKVSVVTGCVLVGRRVQLSREVAAAVVGTAFACQAFTYRYEVDGIYFQQEGALGYMQPDEQAALNWLVPDLLAEHTDALARHHTRQINDLTNLSVTAGGILAKGGGHE